jgi:hypothetical protein
VNHSERGGGHPSAGRRQRRRFPSLGGTGFFPAAGSGISRADAIRGFRRRSPASDSTASLGRTARPESSPGAAAAIHPPSDDASAGGFPSLAWRDQLLSGGGFRFFPERKPSGFPAAIPGVGLRHLSQLDDAAGIIPERGGGDPVRQPGEDVPGGGDDTGGSSLRPWHDGRAFILRRDDGAASGEDRRPEPPTP